MYCAPITFLHYFKEHKYYFKEHKYYFKEHKYYFKEHKYYFKEHKYYFKEHKYYFKEHKYYFKEHKGGGQHPPFYVPKVLQKRCWRTKHAYVFSAVLLIYLTGGGVDAPQANLLKRPCHNLEFYTILYEKFTISYSALKNLLTQPEICTEKCRIKTFLYRLVGKVCTDRPDVFLFLCTNRASGV